MRRALKTLLRPLLPVAAAVRRVWWRVAKPELRGVRVIATDADGRVLLVRHAYGDTVRWRLPGGGAKRRETPIEAARRELREECGLDWRGPAVFGRYESWIEGAHDRITLFTAHAEGTPRPDGFEIAEARWWAADARPPLSPATGRRLDEVAGRRTPDGRW